MQIVAGGFGLREDQFTEVAATVAKSAPDVIFCADDHAVRAIQEAIQTIPIVGLSTDMVAAGFVHALYVTASPLFLNNKLAISALALKARLLTIYSLREEVLAGGLLSYGASIPDLYRRAAELVDRILRGEKPADIPVEQPTKFNLVINLKIAKELGLAVPHNLLVLADEVIE